LHEKGHDHEHIQKSCLCGRRHRDYGGHGAASECDLGSGTRPSLHQERTRLRRKKTDLRWRVDLYQAQVEVHAPGPSTGVHPAEAL